MVGRRRTDQTRPHSDSIHSYGLSDLNRVTIPASKRRYSVQTSTALRSTPSMVKWHEGLWIIAGGVPVGPREYAVPEASEYMLPTGICSVFCPRPDPLWWTSIFRSSTRSLIRPSWEG